MSRHGEGAYVSVRGFKIYYKTFGDGADVLLCLHGGPGGLHDYLLPLGKLGDNRIKVVLYDQLGCGESEKPKDLSLFTIDNGVEEVEGIRQALGLGKVNLLGSSYGGALALQYALKYKHNLKKLVISDGLASMPETIAEMNGLRATLPKDVQETLSKYESLWAYQHPEYLKAVEEFYHRFVCRLPQWPAEVARTLYQVSVPVYWIMNGPNEFTIIGNLKDWDITSRLGEINTPTLVTVGRYGEVTPKVAETIHKGIPGSKLVIFENSSHLAMWEEQDSYLRTVRQFISS